MKNTNFYDEFFTEVANDCDISEMIKNICIIIEISDNTLSFFNFFSSKISNQKAKNQIDWINYLSVIIRLEIRIKFQVILNLLCFVLILQSHCVPLSFIFPKVNKVIEQIWWYYIMTPDTNISWVDDNISWYLYLKDNTSRWTDTIIHIRKDRPIDNWSKGMDLMIIW